MGKVTNDERRRVAAALRWTLKKGAPCSIHESVRFALSKTESESNCDIVTRLADFIEANSDDPDEVEVEMLDRFCAGRIKHYAENEDVEDAHCDADEMLLDLLEKHGYCSVINEFRSMERWYA